MDGKNSLSLFWVESLESVEKEKKQFLVEREAVAYIANELRNGVGFVWYSDVSVSLSRARLRAFSSLIKKWDRVWLLWVNLSSISIWQLILFNGYLWCDFGSIFYILWALWSRQAKRKFCYSRFGMSPSSHLPFTARFFALRTLVHHIHIRYLCSEASVEIMGFFMKRSSRALLVHVFSSCSCSYSCENSNLATKNLNEL